MWSVKQTSTPTVEPVDLNTEVAQQLRLEPNEISAQSAVLNGYIASARAQCESFTQRPLITRTFELWKSSFYSANGCDMFTIPMPPLISVQGITYVDMGGVTQTVPTSTYSVSINTGDQAQKSIVYLQYGQVWPSVMVQPGAVKVAFTAGYGATYAAVPAALRAGMLMMVSEMYERRELAIVGTIQSRNKIASEGLWWPYRVALV